MKKCFLLFLFTSQLFGTESFEIDREDGTHLIGYYDKPEDTSFPIALIIPGSQKETSRHLYDSLKGNLTSIHQCSLTIEKKGITPEKIDEKEFIYSLSHQQRLDDHLLLLQHLQKGLIQGWDGRIAIVGQGDGGRIGAAFATQSPNISALILIASGGAWPPLQESLYSFRSEMADDGYSPQYIHSFLTQAKREFAQALKNPKPEHKAFGYTYKYWESLLKTNLYGDLSKLSCPIYSVHGERDDRIPIESVEALAKELKITFKRKENAGREISQDLSIYEEAFLWLQSTF